jgi:hypothetical protein
MFRRFSNLAVLCIALAAAAGMLAWVSTMAYSYKYPTGLPSVRSGRMSFRVMI